MLQAGPEGAEPGILVVDDDASIRALIRDALEQHGYRVWTAWNGVEALRMVADSGVNVQLIITDVLMPLMGGLSLAKEISRHRPDMPILFVSGNLGENADLPAETLFRKPFSIADLVTCVRLLMPPDQKAVS